MAERSLTPPGFLVCRERVDPGASCPGAPWAARQEDFWRNHLQSLPESIFWMVRANAAGSARAKSSAPGLFARAREFQIYVVRLLLRACRQPGRFSHEVCFRLGKRVPLTFRRCLSDRFASDGSVPHSGTLFWSAALNARGTASIPCACHAPVIGRSPVSFLC